jgi:hypothetical protein
MAKTNLLPNNGRFLSNFALFFQIVNVNVCGVQTKSDPEMFFSTVYTRIKAQITLLWKKIKFHSALL